MPSTDSTVARRIFGRCASKTQHGGYALLCPALNTAELDRLRDQKFESGSLQRGVTCERHGERRKPNRPPVRFRRRGTMIHQDFSGSRRELPRSAR
jgi:hypothetical protein